MSNLSSYSDIELVGQIRGDSRQSQEAAFTELYNRYASQVHAYCYRVLGSEEQAEDVFQETFIKFFKNVRTDLKNSNIPGFLITIARNLCLNVKRDRRPTVLIENLEFILRDYQNYEQKELLDMITRSLELVEEDYREAFVLREYSGLSYQEISDVCGITVANAKSRVFRAKEKIKNILKPVLKDLSN
ncbi:MAG: RNA polymerase sigma factor [Bacteroidota bacterium]